MRVTNGDFKKTVFLSARSARATTTRLIVELTLSLPQKSRGLVRLTPIEHFVFPDKEFKTIGRRISNNPNDNTFRGKDAHVFSSIRQEMPKKILRIINEILDLISKFVKNEGAKSRLIKLIMTLKELSPGYSPAEDFLELIEVIDMLVKSGIEKIFVYLTYAIGQRQDKKRPHEPLTGKLIFKCIEAAGAEHIRNIGVIHPHSDASQTYVDCQVDPIFPVSLPVLYFKSQPELQGRRIIMVAPDTNADDFCGMIGKAIGAEGRIIMEKRRDIKSNKPESSILKGHEYLIRGSDVIYIFADDIYSSLGTLILAYDNIKAIVGDDAVFYAYSTHANFNMKDGVEAMDRLLQTNIRKVITTDSIPHSKEFMEKNKEKVVFLTLKYLLRDLVICNQMGKSAGAMLKTHLKNAIRGVPNIDSLVLNG